MDGAGLIHGIKPMIALAGIKRPFEEWKRHKWDS